MDQATALARLASMTQATVDPVLDAEVLDELVELAATADAEGREPAHPDWTPTYTHAGLRRSAGEGWRRKAGALAARVDVTADGASIKRSSAYQHAIAMAEAYESGDRRRAFTIPLTSGTAPARDPEALPVGNAPEPDWPADGGAGSWPREAARW